MYCSCNFKRKKELKAAILNGDEVMVISPGPFPAPTDGDCSVEGPWYPAPHSWYARVRIVSGRIVKVLG